MNLVNTYFTFRMIELESALLETDCSVSIILIIYGYAHMKKSYTSYIS